MHKTQNVTLVSTVGRVSAGRHYQCLRKIEPRETEPNLHACRETWLAVSMGDYVRPPVSFSKCYLALIPPRTRFPCRYCRHSSAHGNIAYRRPQVAYNVCEPMSHLASYSRRRTHPSWNRGDTRAAGSTVEKYAIPPCVFSGKRGFRDAGPEQMCRQVPVGNSIFPLRVFLKVNVQINLSCSRGTNTMKALSPKWVRESAESEVTDLRRHILWDDNFQSWR